MVAISLVAPAAVVASVFLSAKDLSKGPVLCPLRLATGIPCPFCGMTTSFAHIGGSRIRQAFLANPGGPYLFALFVISGLLLFSGAVFARKLKVEVYSPAIAKPVARFILVGIAATVATMWIAQLTRFGIL